MQYTRGFLKFLFGNIFYEFTKQSIEWKNYAKAAETCCTQNNFLSKELVLSPETKRHISINKTGSPMRVPRMMGHGMT
jgi:hypothetical protein